MPYIEKKQIIKAPVDEVYRVASNMEEYPVFMRDVQSVKIVQRGQNSTVTDWVTDIDGTEIMWNEEDHFDASSHRIDYRLIDGDLDKFEGQWRFDAVPEGTEVTLTCDFDFGIPELVHLIGDILEIKVGENCEMMLDGLKTQLEGQGNN
ncbi:SRPBCC family protein [bacterium]|nr:SRPBCC family protein [bacterium]